MRVQVSESIRHAAGEPSHVTPPLRVRHGSGAVVTRARQTGVRSLVRVSAMVLAVVMLVTVTGVILLSEAACVGRGVVEGPGASQPRRDVEVAEVE